MEVRKDGAFLFTYVQPDGRFATAEKPEDVPPASRRLVRVVDPGKGAHERTETPGVYVVDVAEILAKGNAHARSMSREAFETGALAQLPPGESSRLAERPAQAEAEAAAPAGDAGTGAIEGPAVVTLYGTAWCGACRAARQFLSSKKIPFLDKDVERDPAAARELAEKAARLGVPADRVPILDVRGRLLVGFDRERLEALLGEAT